MKIKYIAALYHGIIQGALIALFVTISLVSCHKEELNNKSLAEYGDRNIQRTSDDDYPFQLLETQDKLKYVVARLIARNLRNDAFVNFLKNRLKNTNQSIQEVFYSEIKNQVLSDGNTFEQMLLHKIRPGQQEEISWIATLQNADRILPDLVITVPFWAKSILDYDTGWEQLSEEGISVWPCLSRNYPSQQNMPLWFGYRQNEVFSAGVHFTSAFDHIPFQIKESEKYMLVSSITGKTWYGRGIDEIFTDTLNTDIQNKLINEYIPLYGAELINYNPDFKILDRFHLQNWLNNKTTHPSGTPQSFPSCEKKCDRDCVEEKNYIDGVEFGNGTVYAIVNNQPGGENVLMLEFHFLTAQMCGDLTVTETCVANKWKKTFSMATADAFPVHVRIMTSQQIQSEIPPGALIIYRKKIKLVDKYVIGYATADCVKTDTYFVAKRLYYLDQGGTHEWNGNIYGSNMLVTVIEHDEEVVTQTTLIQETKSISTKVSTQIIPPQKPYTGAFEFSGHISRLTSNQFVYVAEKAVNLGDFGVHYCNKSFTACIPGQGAHNTGTVVSFLKFE